MFCPKCGAQVPSDAKFCPSCGNVLSVVKTPESIRTASSSQAKSAPSLGKATAKKGAIMRSKEEARDTERLGDEIILAVLLVLAFVCYLAHAPILMIVDLVACGLIAFRLYQLGTPSTAGKRAAASASGKRAVQPRSLTTSAIIGLVGTAIVVILMLIPWADGSVSSTVNQVFGTSYRSTYTVPELNGLDENIDQLAEEYSSAASSTSSSSSGRSVAVSVYNPTYSAFSDFGIPLFFWVGALIVSSAGALMLLLKKGKRVSVAGLVLSCASGFLTLQSIGAVNSRVGFQVLEANTVPTFVIVCSIATVVAMLAVRDA